MKKLFAMLLAAALLLTALSLPACLAEEETDDRPLFLVTDLVCDDSGAAIGVTGIYCAVGYDAENDYETLFYGEEEVTYALSDPYEAIMPTDLMDDVLVCAPVDDLAAWYAQVMLQGAEMEEEAEFYAFTTLITLNDDGEISVIEYVYTPWG